MTIPVELIESDSWPSLRQKIADERAERLEGFLHISTWEAFLQQRSFVEALDWIMAESRPKRPPREVEDDD